ncbi:MAG TPA: hypothetical protein PLW02_08810 [Verrucomicrobiota bacterium]|nr:hypothetical protein [Verrucomicrobiota bacterium]
MAKSIDLISEAINNPKFPFRKAVTRPKKVQRNRYVRRKVKEYLHVSPYIQSEEI